MKNHPPHFHVIEGGKPDEPVSFSDRLATTLRQLCATWEAGNSVTADSPLAADAALLARELRTAGGEADRVFPTDVLGLLRFAGIILNEHQDNECSEVGGDVIQNAGAECGLLTRVVRTEPCGECCTCAEVTDPPYACLVESNLGRLARDAAKKC